MPYTHVDRRDALRRLGRAVTVFALAAAALVGLGSITVAGSTVAGGGASVTQGADPAPAAASDGRVLVLGFDGADWRTTERMMDAGELPNLAKLRGMGTAGPLVSTDPAESAAGWAAINTGANPVKNGVPSFIKRRVTAGGAIMPDFAHVEPIDRDVEDMQTDGAAGVLGGGSSQSVLFGAIVLVAAFLLFKLGIKANAVLSIALAILLGGATAYATRSAGASLPEVIPGVVVNKVRMDGFWVEAARAGHPSVALQAPLAFDRPGAEGARTLYGLGLPDVRSSLNGDWYIYTTDSLATGRPPKGDTRSSSSGTGFIYRVDFKTPEGGGDKAIESSLFGPVDFVEKDRIRRRLDELETEMAEVDDYKTSRALAEEQDDLTKIYAEMGGVPSLAAKEYKHRVTAPLRVVPSGEGAFDVTLGSQTQTLTSGAWSDFYQVEFELSPLVSVHAVTRARVLKDEPFELYVDTLQYDPAKPSFWQPSSSPIGFSADVAQGVGSTFETLGWGCMTNQLKDELLDPEVFLEDVEFTMTFRRKIMERMLEDDDWRILYSVFSTTDRVQHMMYRYHDPEHPKYDAEDASQKVTFFGEEIELRDAIPAIYRQMDSIVGEAMGAMKDGDTLLLCADHGFTSFRRGMHVNNWLEQEGFIVLKDEIGSTGAGFGAIDWSKTRAYSLGLGMVYLNLEGREPEGIVTMDEARGVLEEIRARFLAAEDEGRKAGSSATIVQDVYKGPTEWGALDYPCADLMLGFAEYYRVSWSTVGGGMPLTRNDDGVIVPKPVYTNNTNPWSGDHASNDPNVVTGIFFCSDKVTSEDGKFSVMDIAPTVLSRVG
ncbi:MAG: alkaline phosphatase family protein, partial [Planctomycetota bacterium]